MIIRDFIDNTYNNYRTYNIFEKYYEKMRQKYRILQKKTFCIAVDRPPPKNDRLLVDILPELFLKGLSLYSYLLNVYFIILENRG